MKKGILLGLFASFFFAFTFLLNRSMHLTGGSWVWSASLRYLFTFPIFALLVWRSSGFSRVHTAIRRQPLQWLVWSTVGFGLFYAPICYAGDHGESWLIAASWQVTIVMGLLLSPLFHKRIAVKNLGAAAVILVGVFLLQLKNILSFRLSSVAETLLPILVAAVSYPLGNRKMMALCPPELTTIERVYGMTLCSLPFWLLLAGYGLAAHGAPSGSQAVQSLGVALLSGVIATLLFFRATDLVKSSQRQLAVVESTQSFEVLFTLLGGVLLLHDAPPDLPGWIGVGLIVAGMVASSLASAGRNPSARNPI
ncbi:MAG: multidrug resistance efflux transporter family protein [Clostridiales bacterium]|nr:multidrug resistance efflux transporter family protein [Clostridiales bacterium]